MGATDAFLLIDRLVAESVAPPPMLTVSEWADEKRVLSQKSSAQPGRWRTARTPYLREPMDCLSPRHPVRAIALMFGTQVGKTETGNNWLGYLIDHVPGPIMVVLPTSSVAKRWSRTRLAPMLEETPALRRKVSENRSRDSANTVNLKEFEGGVLVVAGANSAADLRMMPVRDRFCDEVDNYPHDVDGEGDPVELARRRSDNFPTGKELLTSSPTTRGLSRIESAFKAGDQRRYFVPCPHCGERQVLEWENVRWPDGEPERAHYVCVHSGCIVEERHKTEMLDAGEWRATRDVARDGAAPATVRTYHLSSLYSPLGWASWSKLAREFIEAKKAADAGDVTLLKVFVNTRLAETWEEQGDRVEHRALADRAEGYALGTVPPGALVLVASVDVQGNRLEAKCKGYGRGEESWLIDHRVFDGDPERDEVWQALDEWLNTPFTNAHGHAMPVAACAIDSGGHSTHAVYQFCRLRRHRHVFAIKGASTPGKPVLGKPSEVDVNFRGEKIKRGSRLWLVGTDTAKSVIYGRLRIRHAGPGYLHFPSGLADDYFEQLTAERLVTKYVRGRPRLEWVKPAGRRNEALDLEVYAYAAAVYAGVTRMRELEWQKLERRYGPSLFSAAAEGQPDKPGAIPAATESAKTGTSAAAQPAAIARRAAPRPGRRPGDTW
jgi:phage terminase large subunit GpA-like protein